MELLYPEADVILLTLSFTNLPATKEVVTEESNLQFY